MKRPRAKRTGRRWTGFAGGSSTGDPGGLNGTLPLNHFVIAYGRMRPIATSQDDKQ
jgi:hypothetical protein